MGTRPDVRAPAPAEPDLTADTAIFDDLVESERHDDASMSSAAGRGGGAYPAASPRRFSFPWIGKLPFERQVRIWVPMLALAACLSFFFLWLDARHGAESNQVTHLIGEALTHSQRLAKSAPSAVGGDFESFVQLTESRQKVNRALQKLQEMGRAAPEMQKIASIWRPSDEAARQLLDQRALLESLGTSATALAGAAANPAALQQARVAERRIFRESEPFRLELENLREQIAGTRVLEWRIAAALVFGGVVIIAAFGLARAYVLEGDLRAEAAEAEKAIAERFEEQAKRANDLNQTAILRLMNELQEVADGDLTVQTTVSDDITGAIADSVNYTVEELRSLVARINSTARLVNEASSRAQMTASSLQAASEQQSREIRETGEAVLRMAQQINEVSSRASEAVQVARQSLTVSQQGSRAVGKSIDGMNGIRDQIQETAKRIKRLGESSQEIGEIVELISDITEQTNVLALNAAIQAASAGEAGRGFTIVAEEVQRLAERSADATKQVATLIRGIQTDTQDAVGAMERSTQGVVEGTRLSDDAGHALGDIGRVSTQLAELIEGFTNTTSRQAASAGAVAQSIQRILLVTEQTSEGTLQTAGSIRQLAELAQELKNSVARFKVT